MKALLVTFEFLPFSGGIATYADAMAEGLSKLGCRVRVLAPRYPGAERVDPDRVYETVRMGVRHGRWELFRFLPGFGALRRELKTFEPDLVLLVSDLAHGLGAQVCGRQGVPFVPVVHGSEVAKHFPPETLKRYVQSIWLRRAYSRADAVICVSRYVRDLMIRGGLPEGRLRVVHNGIPEDYLRRPADPERIHALRRSLGVEGKRVLLTLSRLVPRKGQAEMIRALPAILERHPEACYVIAGTGEDRERLEELAAGLGLERSVVFAGEIPAEDKIPLLDLCDVYVLPSRREGRRVEGLGIALLEAGARGKPMVAGRHGGIPEVVSHGETGLLVEATDPAELAVAVLRIFGDGARAEAMGAAARRRVEEEFLAPRMAREALDVMREALAERDGFGPDGNPVRSSGHAARTGSRTGG